MEKKRCYEQRIREVDNNSFTPLVLSCTGGTGKLALLFYKRLASMISEKKKLRIVKCFGGFDVVFDLRFSDIRSCVSVDPIHHIGDRSMIA